jgi:hypothetical protein
MGLFARLPIPQVWRRLHPSSDDPEPVESAFTQARQRLGVAPLRHLFEECARPMATHQSVGACYRGGQLMGLGGTVLDLPDTPANEHVFGRPGAARAPAAFPQVRLLALCELGTHAVCGLGIKPCRRSEQAMAPALLRQLRPGMLLLWDRGFFSYDLVRQVLATGAHLLARVQTRLILAPRRRLDDGSYLAKLYPSPQARNQGRDGLWVRVIDDTHDDPNRPGCGERHRLLTDLRNPPDFVVQEVYGLVLAHDVTRRVMHDAAVTASVDPDRLSFSNALRVLHCHLPEAPERPAGEWYQRLLREVRRQQWRPRRERWYPRVIKRKLSNWKKKRPEHRSPPQPTKPFRKAVVILI